MKRMLALSAALLAAYSLSTASPLWAKGKQPSGKAKSSSSQGLTSAQKAAVESALKSLRRLGAATEVGVSQPDYQSRLIDTKADVEEDLRGLPSTNVVVVHINKCLEAYQDASDAWNDKQDFHYWKITKDTPLAAPKVVKKCNIQVDFESDDVQAADRDQLSEYAHGVITKACWKIAKSELDKAEANDK